MHLPELALERPVLAADLIGEEVSRQLHRDGGEALHPPLAGQGIDQRMPQRADGPHPVHPAVLVEPLVLDHHERRDGGGGDLLQRNHRAALGPEVGNEPPVRGVDLGGLRRVVFPDQRCDGGTGPIGAGTGPGRGHRPQAQHQDRGDRGDDVAPDARRVPPPEQSAERGRGHAGNLDGHPGVQHHLRPRRRAPDQLPPAGRACGRPGAFRRIRHP